MNFVAQELCIVLEKQLGVCISCLNAYHKAQKDWISHGDGDLVSAMQLRDSARLSSQLDAVLEVQGPDDDLPFSLTLALYEVLHFNALEDAEVMEGVRKALLHLSSSHDLRLADTRPPPGLYRLLAHHDPNLSSMVREFLPQQLETADDVWPLLTIFRGWATCLADDQPKVHSPGRPHYQQQKSPAWRAFNHVLKTMQPPAMIFLLEQLPRMFPLALEHSGSPNQQSNWAAAECLHSIVQTLQGTVWHFASCSPGAVLASLRRAAAPLSNIKLLTAVVRLMKPLAASVAEYPGERQSLWPQVLCFLLHETRSLIKPAAHQQSLNLVAEQMAIEIVAACHDGGHPITYCIHMFGPHLVRLAAVHSSSANHRLAVLLLCKILMDDAAVLHEVNASPGQSCQVPQAQLTEWLCSPALWKDCGCTQDLDSRVYSAIIQSAALLSRTRGSQAASHGPAGGGAGFHSATGFHSSLFFTALEWPQSWDPCSQQIHSDVRAADHAALLLEHVRRSAGMVLSRPSWNVPETEIGDVAAALARLMVGLDASLRQPAEQALLRITRQPSLEAFIRGESTCALSGFLAALEDELSIVQTLPIMQAMVQQELTSLMLLLERLTNALAAASSQIPSHYSTLAESAWCLVQHVMHEGLQKASMHAAHPALKATFQLLPSAWALTSGCRSSGSRTISEEVLLALGDMSWLTTALLLGLQCPDALSGVWVGSLCQVLDMLPKPISAVLPEECLDIAKRLLAPGSPLSDVAKLRLASYFSSVAPGNIGQKPTEDWPSRMTGTKKTSGAVHSNAAASPQKQKSISEFLASGNASDKRRSSHQAGANLPQQLQSGRERSWHAVTDADVNKLWPTEWPATGHISTHSSHDRNNADNRAKVAPLSKLKAAISKMEGSMPSATPPSALKRPAMRASAAPNVRTPSSGSAAKQSTYRAKESGQSNGPLSITPDRELYTELDKSRSTEQQLERSKLGLPLASKPQRKMIQIAAPPDTNRWAKRRVGTAEDAPAAKASLTMDIVKREMLSHTIRDIVNKGQELQADASKTITWRSVDLYSNTFHDLLQEELRSNIKQALETCQQAECDHVLQLRSIQRQSEMHVAEFSLGTSDEQPFRGSDLILLSSTSKGVDRQDEVQVLVLVESVDRDPSNHDQQIIQGLVNITPKDGSATCQDLQTVLLPRTKWEAKHLLSCIPHLRQFKALCQTTELPPALLQFLLHPQRSSGPATPALRSTGLPQGLQTTLQRLHNPSQQAVIAAALDKRQGFVSLVQGPPGTGKTSTIVAMVSSFLSRSKAVPSEEPNTNTGTAPSCCRVLVCAQSNAAVDELALRLSKGILDGSGKPRCNASVVRLGVLGATSSAVQALHIDTLSGTRAEGEQSAISAADKFTAAKERRIALRKQLAQVRTDIDQAGGKVPGSNWDPGGGDTEPSSREGTPEGQAADQSKAKAKLDALHTRRRQLTAELRAATGEVQAGGQQVQQASREVRAAVIKEAEVIVCTLSTAGGELLTILAAGSHFFNEVIIDEAAQAVEPAALIPLQMLKPNGRVVLVGDPKQLPATVVSRAAERAGLSRSLFERLQQAGVAVCLLAEQYRMHPAISAWPSAYFYASQLKDAPAVLNDARSALFHQTLCFPPLAFFDCREGRESGGCGLEGSAAASIRNSSEVDLACTLFTGLMKEHGSTVGSVAVLSSYKAQVTALRSHFERVHSKAKLAAVEFATIDGFQGREADVVIFSCVRARTGDSGGVGFLADGRRMNVALTRARQSLWILGHVSTLRRCAPWAALIEHVASQGCLFTARGPFEQLLSATREELTADLALLPSSRHTKEKRRDRGSREDLDSQQARQKRQRCEQSSAAAAAASPLTGMESRSRTEVPKGTAKRKHSAVGNSQRSTVAAFASSGAKEAPEHFQEPAAAAAQVHRGAQAASSDGDLHLRTQQIEPPAEQQGPTRAGLQESSGSKASNASKHPGDGPSNKGVGHARSISGRALAGSVTAIPNPLLNRTSLLPEANVKDGRKPGTTK
ncbi:probable helicase SEN1 at C-terminar half [Coccomyxa sp. Obi]|nr:probable helicase SEN1 at C-terminar half [Coccomyxa sp. Obi]